MLGISGGILGDFRSGCGLFPKIPGFVFVDMDGSSGGGDLKGWSHRIKKLLKHTKQRINDDS